MYCYYIVTSLIALFVLPLSIALGSSHYTKTNEVSGVGIVFKKIGDFPCILGFLNDSSARKDGRIEVGDKIIAVDPTGAETSYISTTNITIYQVADLIKGVKGTAVAIKFIDSSSPHKIQSIVIKRELITTADDDGKTRVLVGSCKYTPLKRTGGSKSPWAKKKNGASGAGGIGGASGAPPDNRHLGTCTTNSVLKSSADLETGNQRLMERQEGSLKR